MAKKQAPMSLMDSETRNELAEFDLVQFVETRHSIKKAVVAAIVFAALAVALFLVGYFMAVRPEWFPIDLEVEGGLFAWALALFAALAALAAVSRGIKRRRALRKDMERLEQQGNREDILKGIVTQFAGEEHPVYTVVKSQHITKDWLLDLNSKNARVVRLTDIAALVSVLEIAEDIDTLWAHCVLVDGSLFKFNAMRPLSRGLKGFMEDMAEAAETGNTDSKSPIDFQVEFWDKLFEVLERANPHIVHNDAPVEIRGGKSVTAGNAFLKKRYQAIVDTFHENKTSDK